MKISIIIVIYNSENVLFDCLNSIEKFEIHDNIEVILVDNHQQSKFDQGNLKKYNFDILYFKSPKNGGFGYGNNLGVEKSNHDILLFLNPDTIFTEPVSKITINHFQNNLENNLVIGYKLIDQNFNNNNTIGYFPQTNLLNIILITLLSRLDMYLINHIFLNRYVWPWGAAFSIKKKVFMDCGGFDKNIFLCNEEADLLMRVDKRKVKILNTPIIHLEGHTNDSKIVRYSEYFKSLFYFLKKYNFSKKKFIRTLYLIHWIKKCLNLVDEDLKNKMEALKLIENDNKI